MFVWYLSLQPIFYGTFLFLPLVQQRCFTQKVPLCWLYNYKYTRILSILQDRRSSDL